MKNVFGIIIGLALILVAIVFWSDLPMWRAQTEYSRPAAVRTRIMNIRIESGHWLERACGERQDSDCCFR